MIIYDFNDLLPCLDSDRCSCLVQLALFEQVGLSLHTPSIIGARLPYIHLRLNSDSQTVLLNCLMCSHNFEDLVLLIHITVCFTRRSELQITR